MSVDARTAGGPDGRGSSTSTSTPNQTFDFAGGRLLLRGHNTSGKTKALELLLPFCLDGDIHPTQARPVRVGSKE